MSHRFRIALLLATVVLAYGNSLFNDFAQDDEIYILQNPSVTSFSVRALFVPNKFSFVVRPFTIATFAFNWALAGARPFGYHFFNLLLHMAVTWLLYLLFLALLEPLPRAPAIATVAALLFAVHPIHTEAVTSIVGRSEMLAAGFLLAAWLLYLRSRQFLALLCFSIALLSKESAVIFLPLVLAADYARGKLQPLLRYASIAGLTGLYLAAFWKLHGGRFGTVVPFLDNPLAALPASLRILNAFQVAWKYLGLLVYPVAFSCDYSYDSIPLYANWHAVPAAVASLMVIALWLWTLYTRRTAWAVAGTIYLVGFAITSNLLIPIGTIMGERLAYLPSAGFCLFLALLWVRLENHKPSLAFAILAMTVVPLSLRTIVRNGDWRNNFTLYSAALRVVPRSAKMHQVMADILVSRGELDAARSEFQNALRIYHDYPEALEGFGIFESRIGNDDHARRLLQAAFTLAQKGSLNYNLAVVNLAVQLAKFKQYDQALKLLDQVIADSPGYAPAWSNRAMIRYEQKDISSARSDAQTASRLDPSDLQARNLLSMLNSFVLRPSLH